MSDLLFAEFANAEQVLAGFTEARAIVRKLLVADDIARIAEEKIRTEAPEGLTGKLKAGIHADVIHEPDGFAVDVRSDASHTKWVLGGRGWVFPVRAKALHWVSKSGGDVFSMKAKPVPPNPFHERGWNQARPEIARRWALWGGEVASVLAT